jgi:hypothetical protein
MRVNNVFSLKNVHYAYFNKKQNINYIVIMLKYKSELTSEITVTKQYSYEIRH